MLISYDIFIHGVLFTNNDVGTGGYMINEKILKHLNVPQWHEAGYKGKDIVIDVLDRLYTGKMFGRGTTPCAVGRKHGEQCVSLIREVAPDAIVNLKNYNNSTIMNSKADIICASVTGFATTADDSFMNRAIGKGQVIITSAGNDGENGLTFLAKRNSAISVGAVLLKDGKIEVADYSSRGKNLDVMSFSGHDGGKLQGTSFAAPLFAGMIALLLEKSNKKLNQQDILNVIKKHSQDLEIKGFDVNTGHGLFVLPNIKNIKKEVVEVTKFDWSKDALKWSKENGISDNTRLEENITRREVITLLYRVAMWILKKK